jgi:hypothetical protein
MRLVYYLLNGQLLCFYIIANFRMSQVALVQLGLFYVILHFCSKWYALSGLLDPYVLIVIIHSALITNAPLLILAFRFQLSNVRSHIVFFTVNAGFSFIDFLIAAFADTLGITKWVARNKPFCSELQAAVDDTFVHWINWTMVPIALGMSLAVGLSFVYYYDGWRNRGVPYSPYAWTFLRPRSIVWTQNKWQIQRITVSIIAVLIYVFSIINLEYFIIHNFHSHARLFPDISSGENGWSWGQMGGFLSVLTALGYALWIWLIDVCADSVKLLRTALYVYAN